jgi:hypothetical protein
MPAFGFLFSIEQLERRAIGPYSSPAFRPLFAAVLQADSAGDFSCCVISGDLLLHNLAYRIGSVRFEGRATKTALRGVEHVEQGDPKLFQTLIWDFCDALGHAWHSLDQQAMPDHLAQWDIYAIGLSALDPSAASFIDGELRRQDAYLGAFEVDSGNPIQQRVMIGGLPHAFDYVRRSLLFDPWATEDPFDPPPLTRHGDEWWVGLPLADVEYRDDAQRVTAPQLPSSELSDRGALSAAILARRAGPTHLEQLAQALTHLRVERGTPTFEVDVGAMPRASDAVIEEQKLAGYVLNPCHKSGKHKARVFKSALGLEADDWQFLASQLKAGLGGATTIHKVRSEDHGVKYHVLAPITGLNGRVKPVLSAWEVRAAEPPRLTTAYVYEGDVHPDDLAQLPPPLIVRRELSGTERWKALWEIANEAGLSAAKALIPTPMLVVGKGVREWVPEGEFGTAEIAVPDARRGFARWLVTNGHAHTMRGKGAVMLASGFSVQRAKAYAEAFAAALDANGVAATVTTRLD